MTNVYVYRLAGVGATDDFASRKYLKPLLVLIRVRAANRLPSANVSKVKCKYWCKLVFLPEDLLNILGDILVFGGFVC